MRDKKHAVHTTRDKMRDEVKPPLKKNGIFQPGAPAMHTSRYESRIRRYRAINVQKITWICQATPRPRQRILTDAPRIVLCTLTRCVDERSPPPAVTRNMTEFDL